jgi:bacterial/archaeal transporter family protein
MFFAGFTSVIAKHGMKEVSGEIAIYIRTIFVFIFMSIISLITLKSSDFSSIKMANIGWFALSGLTTTLSWYFYYRALKQGDVATVALIDKGSILIAMLFAWLLLRETITLRMIIGAIFIVSGLLVISRK